MPTYKVAFRTDAEFAIRVFKARSPQAALKQARAFYEDHAEDLMFESYDSGHPVNEIVVRDAAGSEVALWQDDDLRLRLAADDLLAALQHCADCLADPAKRGDGTPARCALAQAQAAIGKATGETAAGTNRRRHLPHDPERTNDDRADWAMAALRAFQAATGCDDADSLGDLLCDLMHLSDRRDLDFEAALCRARGHYAAETAGGRP